MAITVNTNTSSLSAQRAHGKTQQALSRTLAQLSSGSSINSAADNPAGLAIAEGLTTQINTDQQATSNAISGISLAQTAGAALSQLQANTQQIQQLAIQAGNGTLNDANRQALQQQVDQLTQANSQIIQSTQFNGTPLLSGNGSINFQLGSNSAVSLTSSNLDQPAATGGLNGYNANLNATRVIDITTQANALSAQQTVAKDLDTLSTAQSNNGATINRLGTAVENLQTSAINSAETRSRIRDTDFAAASADLAQQQILSQANTATLGQANLVPSAALNLLR